jgi:hypothetical protein
MEYIYISVDTIIQSLWFLPGFPSVAILFDIALAEPRTAYGGGYGRVFGRGIGNRWYNDNIGGSGGGGGGGGGRGGGHLHLPRRLHHYLISLKCNLFSP